MTGPFYFISYSRSQLYYAESVAVQLQRMKIDVWFDLQQLKTGEDWASEIKQGLDGCAGIILIVSQRAMASKYVELEWKAALDAGKPVYLLYFEAAAFTDERLQYCPAVDGRGRFSLAVRQLARAINEGEAPRESARLWSLRPPKPLAGLFAADDDGVMRFPTKLSPGVILITLCVLGISIILFLTMLMVVMVVGVPFSIWLGVLAGYGVLASSHYVRRKLVEEPPRLFVLVSCLGAAAMLGIFQPFPNQQRSMLVLTAFIAAISGIFVLAYVFRGGDVLRWTLTGFAGERRRRRYHGGRWLRRAGNGSHTVQYRVLHSRGDEKFARQFVKAMQKYKHEQIDVAFADHADPYVFFLVSNVTNWEEVRAAVKEHPRLIAAAMTTVTLPQDVYDQIGRFQYLDARTDARRRFEAMAASLTETQVQVNTLSASIETTPANLNLTVIPRRVQAGLGMLRLYAVIGLVAPVLILFQLILMRSASMTTEFSPFVIVVSIAGALIFAVFCFMLDYLSRFRQITTRTFMLLYAGGMITYSVISSVFGGVQILGGDVAANPLTIIPGIVIVFLTSASIFAWLPAVAPHKLALDDLRVQSGSIVRSVILVSVIGAYSAFVILTTSIFGGLGTLQSFSASASFTTGITPVFTSSLTSGNLSVRFPPGLRYVSLSNGQVAAGELGEDPSVRVELQRLVGEVSQNIADDFTPTFSGYAVDTDGILSLVGGQLTPPAGTTDDGYGRGLLREMVQAFSTIDSDLVYQPDYMFGSEPNAVQGSLVRLSLLDDGLPMRVSIVAIDTATAHHLIYIVNSDTPSMQALLERFFALLYPAA